MKRVTLPDSILDLDVGYYCMASTKEAYSIVRKLGFGLPTIGHERHLGGGLWVTHAGYESPISPGYEFRRYSCSAEEVEK